MLRRVHVQPFVRVKDGRLAVEFLEESEKTLGLLDELGRAVREMKGSPRAAVKDALAGWEDHVKDVDRMRGIGKALLDACRFRSPAGADRAPEVRTSLFRARGRRWPPRPGDERAPYEDAARELGIPPEEVDRLLYADSPMAKVLERAPTLDGKALLDLYNLELARGVLLSASRMVATAEGGWSGIFRSLKLARLMYRVFPAPGGQYEVEITGPAAAYVKRAEQRYGVRLARVLPAIARARGWRVDAEVVIRGGTFPFRLDETVAPFGRRPAGRAFDSAWERALSEEFAEKVGAEREGWGLIREARPVPLGDELFIPDFTMRHEDGREALVELVGFWTPEYLEAKLRKVRASGLANLVLVAYRGLRAGADWTGTPGEIVWFSQKPRIGPVMEAVERVARRR